MIDTGTTTAATTTTTGTAATTQAVAPTWRDTLPDDLKIDPSLATVPDVQTLAKNYLETKKAFGSEKMLRPQSTWTEKEWGDFFSAAGRPDTHDKYGMPELKLEEGVKVDEAQMGEFKKLFHEAGLTDAQFKKVVGGYFDKAVNPQIKAQREAEATSRTQLEAALKSEWGRDFDNKAKIAEMALNKFADADMLAHMQSTGLMKHPGLAKFLHNVGSKMLESSALGKDGSGAAGNLPQNLVAQQQIETMKNDRDFQKRFQSGDRNARAQWDEAHRLAAMG